MKRMDCEEGFNSRAREGRDLARHHAMRSRLGFNSRAREGRDRGILQALSANVKSLVFRERQPERGAMRNI